MAMVAIEETDGSFRQFCIELFAAIEGLAGTKKQKLKNCYKVTSNVGSSSKATVFLYVTLYGNTSGNYQQSVRLETFWSDSFKEDSGVKKVEKAFWGNKPGAELRVAVSETDSQRRAIAFVEKALRNHKPK